MPTPAWTSRTTNGAPFALAAHRPLSAPRRVAAAVCRAGTRRCTSPRTKAVLHPSRSSCCAAPTGPSRPTTGNAALRRTAETKNRNSRARAGARRSNGRKGMGSSRSTKWERGRCTPPAASQAPHPSCLAPHPSPRCLCRRCVPSALADPAGREATAHTALCNERPSPRASSCTIAPAGRSVEEIAPELLLPSAAQRALAHAVLCRSQRCGTGA